MTSLFSFQYIQDSSPLSRICNLTTPIQHSLYNTKSVLSIPKGRWNSRMTMILITTLLLFSKCWVYDTRNFGAMSLMAFDVATMMHHHIGVFCLFACLCPCPCLCIFAPYWCVFHCGWWWREGGWVPGGGGVPSSFCAQSPKTDCGRKAFSQYCRQPAKRGTKARGIKILRELGSAAGKSFDIRWYQISRIPGIENFRKLFWVKYLFLSFLPPGGH